MLQNITMKWIATIRRSVSFLISHTKIELNKYRKKSSLNHFINNNRLCAYNLWLLITKNQERNNDVLFLSI